MRLKIMRICRGEAVAAVPQDPVRYDLETAARTLESKGYEVSPSDVMVVATKKSVEITLYQNGRLMIRPSMEKEDATITASGFYADIQAASLGSD
jgi:hypothetical protein